jgi:preprotein translocase subunit SecB
MNPNTEENKTVPTFSLEKIYCKDISLEMPHAPEMFLLLNEETPQLDLQLGNHVKDLGNHFYESSITATLSAKFKDEKVAFLIELTQAGIFHIEHVGAEDFELLTQITCPSTIYPYLREAIANIASRAGFTNIILSPINFEQLYAQKYAENLENHNEQEQKVTA